jgi:hypothetical protein
LLKVVTGVDVDARARVRARAISQTTKHKHSPARTHAETGPSARAKTPPHLARVARERGRVELRRQHGAVRGAAAVEDRCPHARVARLQDGVLHVRVAAAAGQPREQHEHGGVFGQVLRMR